MTLAKTNPDLLPALPFDSWKDTLATLHMWTQVVGKVRLKLCPLVNHFWNVTFLPDRTRHDDRGNALRGWNGRDTSSISSTTSS